MDNIWSPWRMEFIKDKRFKEGGAPCIFCELKTLTPSTENLVLYKGEAVYVVMNRFPYTNGHLLIIPNAHSSNLDLGAKADQEILKLMAASIDILRNTLNAEGFNCGLNLGKVAGAGIADHLHWHIVPRWNGDSNFMPVMSSHRLMPEYLSETYKRLEKGFQKLGG